jgi:hypothetical protein
MAADPYCRNRQKSAIFGQIFSETGRPDPGKAMHIRTVAAILALAVSVPQLPAAAAEPTLYTGKAVVTAVSATCPSSLPAGLDTSGTPFYTIVYLTSPAQFTLNGHEWMQQFTAKLTKTFKWQAIANTTDFAGPTNVGYSGFSFKVLSKTAARLSVTIKFSKTCSESFRAALTLAPS